MINMSNNEAAFSAGERRMAHSTLGISYCFKWRSSYICCLEVGEEKSRNWRSGLNRWCTDCWVNERAELDGKAVVYWSVPILTYGHKLQAEIQTADLANTNFKNLHLVKSDIKAHLTSGKAKRRNPVY